MKKILTLGTAICIMVTLFSVSAIAAESWFWPMGSAYGYNKISSSYGYRTYNNKNHNGIDIAAPAGTNIYASRSGTVSSAGYSSTAGNNVIIDHGDGYTTVYMHMSSIATSKGAKVSRGQVIGYVGKTGSADGNHLHFEIKYNGSYVNPNPSDYPIQGSVVNGVRGNIKYSFDMTSTSSQTVGISNPNQLIQSGSKGTAVIELQTSLNKIMNAGLDVDGNFGPKTQAAVKAFQSKYGLTADGIAGPKTNAKINELLRHTHSYKYYNDEAHPHKEYKLCSCGNKVYTGNTKNIDNCTTCNPPHQHSYTTKYEDKHPHKEIKSCSGCGAVEYTGNTKKVESCDECHEHSFEILTEIEHPHYEYKVCEECEYSEYTGELSEDEYCDECYPCEHDYSKKVRKAHPHAVYYKCRDCGDIMETDETQMDEDCDECYPEEEIETSGKRTLKLQIGVPQMYINGVSTEIDPGRGTVPIMQNDRTLLPIRAVVETFGAYVIWDEEEEKVTVISDDVTIQLWINQQVAFVNGEIRELDVAPVTINSRTFMPLRFIAENLGLTVGWNEANQTVTVEGEI